MTPSLDLPVNRAAFLTGGDIAPVGVRGKGMFGPLAPLFQAADFSFLNVEHPLSLQGAAVRGKKFLHRGAPEHVAGLAEAGVRAINLANNHILDYGPDGLMGTIRELERTGLPYFGAGLDIDEASAPLVMQHNGLRVGLLGYTSTLPSGFAADARNPGVNPLRVRTAYRPPYNLDELPGTPPVIETWPVGSDVHAMMQKIRDAKREVDVVLVYVHWGTSCTPHVHQHQRTIGHAAIDAGAAGVFGGHQHVVSAIEFYKSKPIVHCTGDLIFDVIEPWFGEDTTRTFLFGGTLTQSGLEDCYILCCRTGINSPPTIEAPGSRMGQQILNDIRRNSAPFGIDMFQEGDRVYVRPGMPPEVRSLDGVLHPMGFSAAPLAETDLGDVESELRGSGDALFS